MNWSDKQIKIYNEYEETDNNLAIEAAPGSGKSTCLLEILRRTPPFKKSIFLAFNKSIQQELSLKVPTGVECSTLHSLGYKILLKNSSARYKLTEIKTWILGKKHLNLENIKDPKKQSIYLFHVSNLYDLYRMNLCTSMQDLMVVASKYGVDCFEEDLKDVEKMIKFLEKYNSNTSGKEVMIDFIDMLYLPVKNVPQDKFPKYDVVLVDECQDISNVQWELIKKLFKRRTRFVAVGDPFQAIYSFQGSDKDVFTKIKSMPKTTVLPLSYSYRCGTRIVEEANKVFPFIESPEGQHTGEVIYNGTLDEVRPHDFILCRNNQPLIEVFLKLLKDGKKARILGRDFGKGLLNVLLKIEDFDKESINGLMMSKKNQLEEKGIKKPEAHISYQSLLEKVLILIELNKAFPNIEDLRSMINSMFSDNEHEDAIILSTIHKSKGLEADNVFIVGFDELIPSRFAETEMEKNGELCLKYVAISRAKNKLTFVPLNQI